MLTAYQIQSDLDVDRLRRIRNLTRLGYSNHTEQISTEQQRAWWAENHERMMGWLYRDDFKMLVGFGLLRQDDEGLWVTTVGVLPGYTGHNYGKAIMRSILEAAPGRCSGAARKDNPAAVKLYVESDWEPVPGDDPRLVYFLSRVGVPA